MLQLTRERAREIAKLISNLNDPTNSDYIKAIKDLEEYAEKCNDYIKNPLAGANTCL